MTKEGMETLNLKTSIVVGDGKLIFELYSIEKGGIKEVKINNDVFVLNNGFKQNNETKITKTDENDTSEPQPVNKKEKIEELIVDMINGDNDKIIPPVIPPVKSPKSFNTIYGVDDIIASPGEYITCALYKTVLDEILNNVSPVFTNGDVSNIILDVYKKIGRRISTGSAYVYSGAYRKYMLAHGLIQVKDEIKKIYEVANQDKKHTVKKTPDNTMLFLNWLDKRDGAIFTLGDVVKEISISKEKAVNIVDHQLELGNLQQPSKYEFKTTKIPKVIDKPPVEKSTLEKWIIDNNIVEFGMEDFFEKFPEQRKHRARVEHTVSLLCQKDKLRQRGSNKFRITNLFNQEEST